MELGGQNCPAVAFKPSYFTRGKDGAPSEVVPPLSADADKGDQDTVIAFDTTQITSAANYSHPQPGDPFHPLAKTAHAPAIAFSSKDHGMDATEDLAPTLRSMGHDASHANGGGQMAVAFQESQTGCREYVSAGTLRSNGPGHDPVGTRIREGMAVRRLTPLECERLMGQRDNYTNVSHRGKPASDGPRYKALGNSMAVPVLTWIGTRIKTIIEP